MHSHRVEKHDGKTDISNLVIDHSKSPEESNEIDVDGISEATDVYLYAVEANKLVETDRMIRLVRLNINTWRRDKVDLESWHCSMIC